MLSVPSQPGVNRGERLGEFESRSVKTGDAVEGVHQLENSHKLCRDFQQAMKAPRTRPIYLKKLKDKTRTTYMYIVLFLSLQL